MQNQNKVAESMQRTAQAMGNTIADVIDKLAGKKSDLKLSFEDLSLDTGIFKAKMTGAITLETTLAAETSAANQAPSNQTTVYNAS